MPSTQPAALNVNENDWRELQRQLNYIFKDIYNWFDYIRGVGNYTFDPISLGEHNHQSDDQGGDYPWADFIGQDVTYLQILRGAITVTNLLDKTASEEISGTYKLTALTASRLLALNASKEIIAQTPESHITDAQTSHAITDPGDSPVDADALRDDLVANTIPDIESALNALGTVINLILVVLENINATATS